MAHLELIDETLRTMSDICGLRQLRQLIRHHVLKDGPTSSNTHCRSQSTEASVHAGGSSAMLTAGNRLDREVDAGEDDDIL